MKRINIVRFFAMVLIIAGVLVLAPLQFAKWQQIQAVANQPDTPMVIPAETVTQPDKITGHPTRVIIPSLGIDIPVLEGVYNPRTGDWTLSEKNAHYAVLSALPNNLSGNTLIYGHYNKYVFRSLHTIVAGAEAQVITTEGYRFVYTFNNAEVLQPTDTTVFNYSGASRLTLQTCSGRFMQNRHMHYFQFVRYEKI